jgi:cytochrome c oxidase subunit 2
MVGVRRPPPLVRRVLAPVLAAGLLASCATDETPSMLEPRGPAAQRIEGLWWLLLWISLIVFVVVLSFLAVAIIRGRRRGDDTVDTQRVPWGNRFIALSGVVVPSVVLGAVFVLSLRDMSALSPEGSSDNLTIEVVGHDWWWELRYPESGAVTANEIHIPVGEPVRLLLTTQDVIHSFWVPQLQVKSDMINGRSNELWIEADEPGRYRGQCAEFCGLQHSNMIFFVVAEQREDFDAWLQRESLPAASPTAAAQHGEQVFLDSTCVGCHAIRGTPARASVGPDLTHLMLRSTIASGVLPNTRANLAQWITDPQEVKPGNTMPPTNLSPEDLEALLDYLQTLD